MSDVDEIAAFLESSSERVRASLAHERTRLASIRQLERHLNEAPRQLFVDDERAAVHRLAQTAAARVAELETTLKQQETTEHAAYRRARELLAERTRVLDAAFVDASTHNTDLLDIFLPRHHELQAECEEQVRRAAAAAERADDA